MKKSVFITGAAGNLGHYVVSVFLRNNWIVIAGCTNDNDIAAFSSINNVKPVRCNCLIEHDVQKVFTENHVDAVVHLVGGIKAGVEISEMSFELFNEMYELNVKSTFIILRESLKHMKNSGGSITTIGAKSAVHTEKNKAAYSTAKSSVVHLTMVAAEEGKEYNVRCNCIIPGIIKTVANMEWAHDGEENQWTEPEDIAETIHYLSSDSGKGVSGAIIPMFGKLPM